MAHAWRNIASPFGPRQLAAHKQPKVLAWLARHPRESWSRRRRVIAKAEWTKGEANPRFIVTSLKPGEVTGRHLYEEAY